MPTRVAPKLLLPVPILFRSFSVISSPRGLDQLSYSDKIETAPLLPTGEIRRVIVSVTGPAGAGRRQVAGFFFLDPCSRSQRSQLSITWHQMTPKATGRRDGWGFLDNGVGTGIEPHVGIQLRSHWIPRGCGGGIGIPDPISRLPSYSLHRVYI